MLRHAWFKNKTQTQTSSVNTPALSLPVVPGILPIQTIDDLLSPVGGYITQVEELAGLSKENFQRFYLIAIQSFARFVQHLPASEVHHHAGPGGMLTHTLEVCVNALKIRRSYLLSETGGAEEISAKQDVWTYAVFTAALCHDVAKVVVDQTVTIYNSQHPATAWNPMAALYGRAGQGLYH